MYYSIAHEKALMWWFRFLLLFLPEIRSFCKTSEVQQEMDETITKSNKIDDEQVSRKSLILLYLKNKSVNEQRNSICHKHLSEVH